MPTPPRQLHPERSVRHLFGSKLRDHRELAGWSLDALAPRLQLSRSVLSRIEGAETPIPPHLPPRLDELFDCGHTFRELYPLAVKEVHPDQYKRQMDLEQRATITCVFAGMLIPGLIQTEGYARALLTDALSCPSVSEVEDRVAARLSRQSVLQKNPAPEFSAVLDESVVRRQIGPDDVWLEQLEFLLSLVDTATSSLQVLPHGRKSHGLFGGELTLWTLPNGSTVAYEESIDSGTLLEECEAVRLRRRAYDRVRGTALSSEETADLIRHVIRSNPEDRGHERSPSGV